MAGGAQMGTAAIGCGFDRSFEFLGFPKKYHLHVQYHCYG